MSKRCQHDAARLYNEPGKADLAGWLFYGRHADWVRCAKCGATGYWGGYGARRRVRWGYGGPGIMQDAEKWNRWIAERANVSPA